MAGPVSSEASHKQILQYLNTFDLNDMIGSGTFSEVYRATNRRTKEVIALKCFRDQMKSAIKYHLAAKEIAFMKILDHPNIVQLRVFEVNREFVYLGTEYAAFGSLKRFLADRKPLPESFIQGVMKQILGGLDYMHNLGILHGDIKPHNILCTAMNLNRPTVKICDFGLSEIKLKGQCLNYSSGSYLFMAPEVHLKHPVDVTCDLWSAGVVMYNMMFSRSLFRLRDKEIEKQVVLLRRKTPLNYEGSELYSLNCNDLVRRLLTYEKRHRIQGVTLRCHPFLYLASPKNYGNQFLDKARNRIGQAIKFSNHKKYGEALVEGIQAVIELKIHHNLLDDEGLQAQLKQKWEQYDTFIGHVESRLIAAPEITLDNMKKGLSDEEFKKHLASTPKLLYGFEIGCNAEMYQKEKNLPKALNLYHQALQTLLPLMKTEPKSFRKEILGRRLSKWIQEVENLNKMLTPDCVEAIPTTSAATN